MMSVIDERADGKVVDPWCLFERSGGMAHRRTRLAFEPKSGSLVLIGELFLAGIDYWQLAQALENFARDCRDTLTAPVVGVAAGDSLPSFANDEVIIRM